MEPSIDKSKRLGVGHLLAWMAGCGAVLAIFRVMIDTSQGPESAALEMRLQQLGYGLAYGTAISGAGLFLWWRWRGQAVRPTQPGHWLLVLGGIGLIINLAAAGAAHAITPLLWDFDIAASEWMLFQALGWTGACAAGIVLLSRLRGPPRWQVVARLIVAVLVVQVAVYGFALGCEISRVRGSWYLWLTFWVRLTGMAACMVAVAAAETLDRRERMPRDWLHAAGILAAMALVGIDVLITAWYLIAYGL